MILSGSARRKARSGSGVLPPNPIQWENEHNGLDLRADIGISDVDCLEYADAFALMPQVTILPHGEIPAAAMHIEHFRGIGSKKWSGFSLRLADDLE